MALAELLWLVEAIATLAFAASGLIAAARRKLDAFGVFTVTGVAAFGGGTLRDVLLDQRPFFWVRHSQWLLVLLVLCVAAMWLMRSRRQFAWTERAIQVPDAIGLGLFSALGTQIAWAQSLPWIVCVLMGITTAVFGGVLRDLLCNSLPQAFSDHKPYAVIAFAGGVGQVAMLAYGIAPDIALLATAAVVGLLRLLAIRRDWRLPGWNVEGD